MDLNSAIKEFSQEIKGKQRKDVIDFLESFLIQNIEELSNFEAFFKLPLENIFILSQKSTLL